ncbi:urea ABC transporter ATP-binding subunit UrtE [Ensifer sp. ENS04]|uniref:urea ABC transporter ATP-binding subunit UrtE n=1 Tax=Ensifer sp. ENS04 TaxID=2769281 RepID=UPI0017846580|nr:urea ABC transporter ATP-binding subunit UrtE [Ensifer sp. ENS04]MBD9541386.1 urea ABC transporter ATP-binding subunit UrtE [Ensifer sp. ENS04]
MLNLAHLDSFYGRSHILHSVSLSVPHPFITVVLGRNGTGKTTLFNTLMGLTDRASGKIEFFGEEISEKRSHQRARAGIAYVPQGREIIPDFSVKENILMGTYARSDGRTKIPDVVGDLFPYLMENLNRPGGLLSGGQQQQLAIARALASDPKLLLMDEPTEGIQPNIVAEIEHLIVKLNSEAGISILLVEQNVEFARRAGQFFAMMEKGRVVASGKMETLSDDLIHRHLVI